LSEDAYRQARGRIEAEFVDLGEQSLKNIAHAVRVYALTPAGIAAAKAESPAVGAAIPSADAAKSRGVWARWPALAAALALVLLAAGAFGWRAGLAPRFMAASVDDKLKTAPRLSIVVLPFENLSGDKEQDYFADGITDDLTADLSHLEGSFVISRGTAFTYKGKLADAKKIGHELGVRYVLEGSVGRLGDKIEINAQLISTETGAHVWADRFDGERDKLGTLQVEVVARLARSLGVEMVRSEALRAMREQPNNPESVDLRMRAMTKTTSGAYGKATNTEIIDLSERALALDPTSVPAMVDLASALITRVTVLWSDDPPRDIARADKFAEAALALQPDLSRAHLAKALILSAKRQWGPAIAQAEAAVALDRNNASAHAFASLWKVFLGRSEDGFAGVETALRLSPRDPDAPVWQSMMCHLHTRPTPRVSARSGLRRTCSTSAWRCAAPARAIPT
jgi:TolB-like protein